MSHLSNISHQKNQRFFYEIWADSLNKTVARKFYSALIQSLHNSPFIKRNLTDVALTKKNDKAFFFVTDVNFAYRINKKKEYGWAIEDLNLWPQTYQVCALTNWANSPHFFIYIFSYCFIYIVSYIFFHIYFFIYIFSYIFFHIYFF